MSLRFSKSRIWVWLAAFVVAVSGINGFSDEEKIVVVWPPTPAHLEDMVKISPKRHSLDPKMMTLCASSTLFERGPHKNAEVLVYANHKVIDYRKENVERGDYPVGSVLLKEKYADLKVEKPHLATIMRRTGNDGGVDDWDFSMISLPGGKAVAMTANEKAACADCHGRFRTPGYLSIYSNALLWQVGKDAEAEASAARPNVDSKGFLRIAAEAEKLREDRLVSAEEFAAYAKREKAVVLDARGREAFAREHVRGAVNLPYTEFTPDALEKVIPSKSTQVLIYCDNNIRYPPVQSAKPADSVNIGGGFKGRSAALNIPTFITLYGYGYRNLYELGPSVTPGKTVIEFVAGKRSVIRSRGR